MSQWRETPLGAPETTGGGGAACVVDGMFVVMHHIGASAKVHRLTLIPKSLLSVR